MPTVSPVFQTLLFGDADDVLARHNGFPFLEAHVEKRLGSVPVFYAHALKELDYNVFACFLCADFGEQLFDYLFGGHRFEGDVG